jgi:hypothetical protein
VMPAAHQAHGRSFNLRFRSSQCAFLLLFLSALSAWLVLPL